MRRADRADLKFGQPEQLVKMTAAASFRTPEKSKSFGRGFGGGAEERAWGTAEKLKSTRSGGGETKSHSGNAHRPKSRATSGEEKLFSPTAAERTKGGSRTALDDRPPFSTTTDRVKSRSLVEERLLSSERVKTRATFDDKVVSTCVEKVRNKTAPEERLLSSSTDRGKSRNGVEEKGAVGTVEEPKTNSRAVSGAERISGSSFASTSASDIARNKTSNDMGVGASGGEEMYATPPKSKTGGKENLIAAAVVERICSSSTTTTTTTITTSEKMKNNNAGKSAGTRGEETPCSTPTLFKSRGGGEEKIFVTVRVRPLSVKELARGDYEDWECPNDHTVALIHPLPDRAPYPASYTFDRVFGPECTNERVYEKGAKDVALSSLNGLNSTIFAYGQTSSGKTYTMRGITETAVQDIYTFIEKHQDRNFVLKVSAIEIYNEIVKDLLNPESGPLRLLDDPERGTVVERLQEDIVRDASHLREILAICEAQRQVGETTLNDNSSRSHQIIRVTVESSPREILPGVISNALVASLNFVDLAGSERASQTLSEGTRLKEGGHINRSLLTLSSCIRKLSQGGRKKEHIPYRDSKLTRILQHSLGGNARTAIICTMSPAHVHLEQSRNTLNFANRAKEVTNTAHVNVVVDDKALVKQLQREVARLEASLRIPDSPAVPSAEATEALLTSEALLLAKEKQIKEMAVEMEKLVRQRDAAQVLLDEVTDRMRRAEHEAAERAKELETKTSELQTLEHESLILSLQHQLESDTPRSYLSHSPSWSGLDDASVSSRQLAIVPVKRNLSSDLTTALQLHSNGRRLSLRQSAASHMLVQEIRKLEHLQDELGEDANRALEALQKEVECLRLAQAGMNQDTASTIRKLQGEVRTMHVVRVAGTEGVESSSERPQYLPLPPPVSMSKPLREELLRLQPLGEDERGQANVTIATLEEQLESVQKSLDKMVLNEPSGITGAVDEDSKSALGPSSRKKKATPLTHSGVTRQRLVAGSPNSPQSDARALENNENTPPRSDTRENSTSRSGDNTSIDSPGKQKTPRKSGAEESPGTVGSKEAMHRRSTSVDIRKMQNLFKTAAEDNIKSIRAYVTELKERVAKLQYQKQLLVCQVLELETNADAASEVDAEDLDQSQVAPVIPWSPGAWRRQYEKQRQTIIELWDACQVSIIHRTQFYLLFKGDASDAIYLEVELRRLNWIQDQNVTAAFEAAQNGYQSTDEASTSPLSGEKSLRREREMLVKRMRARMSPDEREKLFAEWGIPLDMKQRKAQLCNKIWTDPIDIAHVQASAEVVARIVGFWEPGSTASKEMFGLTFAPPSNAKNPLLAGWSSISTLLNF